MLSIVTYPNPPAAKAIAVDLPISLIQWIPLTPFSTPNPPGIKSPVAIFLAIKVDPAAVKGTTFFNIFSVLADLMAFI